MTDIEQDVAAAEAAAPIDTTGPLPRTVSTLAYVPKERRPAYARGMDGTFTLRHIYRDDVASLTAYEKDIAAGKLPVYEPGDTPEARAERRAAADAKVQAILAAANAQDAAVKEAKRKLAFDRQQAELNARFGR